jgi:hypothetical protein
VVSEKDEGDDVAVPPAEGGLLLPDADPDLGGDPEDDGEG